MITLVLIALITSGGDYDINRITIMNAAAITITIKPTSIS